MIKKLFLLSAVALFSCAGVFDNHKDYADAQKAASSSGKKVFLFVEGNGCPYCVKMKKETFTDQNVIEHLNTNYAVVKVNKDEAELPEGVNPFVVPSVFVLDPEDNMNLYTTFGYKSAEHLVKELTKNVPSN